MPCSHIGTQTHRADRSLLQQPPAFSRTSVVFANHTSKCFARFGANVRPVFRRCCYPPVPNLTICTAFHELNMLCLNTSTTGRPTNSPNLSGSDPIANFAILHTIPPRSHLGHNKIRLMRRQRPRREAEGAWNWKDGEGFICDVLTVCRAKLASVHHQSFRNREVARVSTYNRQRVHETL